MITQRMRVGAAALFFAVSGAALAKAGDPPIFDWINPAGGSFDDPANWSPTGTPFFDDTIRFDLGAAYLIDDDDIVVAQTFIGRDEVTIDVFLSGKGEGYATFGDLSIGGGLYDFPRDLDAPGRLTMVGESSSFTNTFLLGSGRLASQLVLEGDTSLSANTFSMTPASSLGFRVDASTDTNWPLFEAYSTGKDVVLPGAIQIGDNRGAPAPPLGTVFDLVQVYLSIDSASFPFVATAPRPGRSLQIDVSQDKGGSRVRAQVGVSDTVSSVSLSESDDLAEAPTRIVTADLDEDGRDDLVVLLPSGTARVYPSTATGFDTPVDYAVGAGPVDAAAGDFDDDGKIDLAIGCAGSGTLEYLLNPFADATQLQAGPVEAVEGEIRSLATTIFPGSVPGLTGTTGASVTSKEGSRGRTRGYQTDGSSVIKVAEIEVGDDPGPSDPIDDENKKDPDPPIGVGGLGSTAFGGGPIQPVLTILQPSEAEAGYTPVRNVQLTGRAVDFVSSDFNYDGQIEIFLVTENGQLNFFRPFVTQSAVNSVHLDGIPTSMAMGDLDGDSRPEIVIGLADPPRIELHRVVLNTAQAQGAPPRVILERYATRFLSEVPAAVTVAEATDAPADAEVVIGLEGDGGGGSPSVNIGDVEDVPTPDCVFSDFNGDGEVNGFDLAYIFSWWGPCQSLNCPFDLNGDGEVGAPDLGILMSDWGQCLP